MIYLFIQSIGNVPGSKFHITLKNKCTAKVNKMIDITFIQMPVLTMSGIFKYPDPKTIAFGGVATGSINAQDAATVAEAINI